jgi:hypothetical protein
LRVLHGRLGIDKKTPATRRRKKGNNMVFTHAEGKAALKHIIENVFELPCDGPLAKTLLAMHVKDI